MSKIIPEQEVSLAILSEYLEEAGWKIRLQSQRIFLRSPRGLGFSISLDSERQFLMFATYFSFSSEFTHRLELVNTLSSEVFLGCFFLDDDGDLNVNYMASYELGLIFPQFARLTHRFAGMIDHVVNYFDKDEVIFDFGPKSIPAPDSLPNLLQ